jgi:hypothetical protein
MQAPLLANTLWIRGVDDGRPSMRCEDEKRALDGAQQRLKAAIQRCQDEHGEGSPGYNQCLTGLGREHGDVSRARDAYNACTATQVRASAGRVVYLRVHEPGSGYGGGSSNWFDADVVFRLDSTDSEGKAFGFQLRDENVAVREGMLSILREAVAHNLRVVTEYHQFVNEPDQNLFVFRVAILVDLPPRDPFDDVRVHP